MMQAMNEPGKYKGKLLELMTAFAALSNHYEVNSDSPKDDDVPVMLGRIAKAICLLLTPFPKHGCPADLQAAQAFKGTNVIMITFRDLLLKHPWWQKACNDLVNKGAATTLYQAKLSEFLQRLESNEQLDAAFIKEVACELPQMKTKMRAGCTDALEKLFLAKLQKTCEEFLCGTSLTGSMGMLEAIASGLALFQQSKGVLQLSNKLMAYKENNLNKLACMELKELCSSYPESQSDLPVPDTAASRKETVSRVLEMCNQVELDSETLKEMKRLAYWIFRGVSLQFQVLGVSK